MKISVPLDHGFLPDRYGKYADEAHRYKGSSCTSFPIAIHDIPTAAQCLALLFYDLDSIPVCGFAFIHWTAANIAIQDEIKENASITGLGVQGANSAGSKFIGATDLLVINRYRGPNPPDKDHRYTLRVYALDSELPLEEGFYANELIHHMQGHIVAEAVLEIPSRT